MESIRPGAWSASSSAISADTRSICPQSAGICGFYERLATWISGCDHHWVSAPSGKKPTFVPHTDAELLLAARTDPQAFREFYDRYAVWVRSWFQRQTSSEIAALDLTAETFAQAWRSVKRFRDEADGSGAPWLFGIARNLLRQFHKHNRIETQARERLGLPLAFAESEEYERVDDRIAASS